MVSSAPVLAAPVFTKPFKIQVDASDIGAVANLLQEEKAETDHPVCSFSRLTVTIKAIVVGTLALICVFEVYVGPSALVTLYTDHNPLTFLARVKNANHRLMC